MKLNTFQEKLNKDHPYDFSGLKTIFLNCTLIKSPEMSHTERLIRMCKAIMNANGIGTEIETDFTNRNTTSITWNLMHQAKILQNNDIPAYGNQRIASDDRKNKDHPNPEFRQT